MSEALPVLSLYALMAWTGNTSPLDLTSAVLISVAQNTKTHECKQSRGILKDPPCFICFLKVIFIC
jgi:hypothetical protein